MLIAMRLEQAKERYNFVILERRDQYVKELNSLLKDVKSQSELHATKIRNLLSNLLRDVLAAIVLVGFTLFSKVSDIVQLNESHLLVYIFTGLGIYYIVSIALQATIDLVDVWTSKQEMFYWENVTKELIPAGDFKKHVANSLRSRVCGFSIIYPIIAFIYLVLAVACFLFPNYWKQFVF